MGAKLSQFPKFPEKGPMVQFILVPPLFGKILNITGKNLGDFFFL